jgi:iron complex outermembrane receptor protein
MNKHLLFGLLIGCIGSVAWAQEDEQAYLAFMALLNKQTELVTKTKLNADYVPGSVTVLQGDELRGYGARTVFDAVGFAPGIALQRNHMGHHVLVVRGMGTPFSGGMVKLMLDNVNYVGSAAGYAETLLNMPLDQVERIEIIRGAASVLHGDFAYAGVVNVVTKSRNYAAVSYGSNQFAAVNLSHRFALAESGSSIGVQLAQWQRASTDTRASGDMLTQADKYVFAGLAAYSQAPANINDNQRFRQLGLDWQSEHNRA